MREIAGLLGENPELPSGETLFKRGQHGESAADGSDAVHVALEEAGPTQEARVDDPSGRFDAPSS